MATTTEQVFETAVKRCLSKQNDSVQHFYKFMLRKFQKSSLLSSSEAAAAAALTEGGCTLEDFAIFYLSMVKSQTDEFIKSNTSTCNTPHKVHLGETVASTTTDIAVVTEPLCRDGNNKKAIEATAVGGGGDGGGNGGSSLQQQQQQQRQHASVSHEGKSGKPAKRQISRELFVNHDAGNQVARDKSQRAPEVASPSVQSCDAQVAQATSTPNNSSSMTTTMMMRMNRSMGEEQQPTHTSTPNNSSFFNSTRNSLSFDHSYMLQQRGGGNNSSRKSLNVSAGSNTSANRRNTSSPFCLGDFISTSSASNKSSRRKNTSAGQEPKFSTSDFPALETSGDSRAQQPRPKKRVMPITVSRKASAETPNFISSSFQSENNLLHVATLEAHEPVHEMLREHRDAITKDFHNERTPARNLRAQIKENFVASPLQSSPGPMTPRKVAPDFEEAKIEKRELLAAMAKIYAFLIDANHVPNILSELSYLVNLLNAEHNPYEHHTQNYEQMGSHTDVAAHLLKNYHNCIFFAACVLGHQRHTLAMLDATTIRVICDYERIQRATPALYEYLRGVVQRKMQMDTLMSSHRGRSDASDINKVVHYQQETDNRDNFPSDREFGAFKNQRDMFYAILRSWELKHLDPSWDFRREMGARVRALLTLLEHPINMAHLAKLFTAQLIISCNFDNELQMALPNVDLSKLSKLRQRLVAPSVFSTQYLFPGNQAFFRDFIICCDFHMMFIEQLKIALISELLQMNDSSMETLSIARGDATASAPATVDDDSSKEKRFEREFIVRGETISTMRVIGKFIGFVVARSYSYDGYRNSLVDQKQMSIRNMMHPEFDVQSVVLRAIDGRKLLVTIPWLVEYLSMLDFITIRLDYYRELFRILYTLYMSVSAATDVDSGGFCVLPQSKFIVRTCLGFLFEHPSVPEDYFSASMMLTSLCVASASDSSKNTTATGDELNPHLESVIHAACPFLADFRVSMMPQKSRTTKAVSRTGRYRHITTKIQDKTTSAVGGFSSGRPLSTHERLVEAFLASQSLSVRKIVDFTIDRASSAVIKDFQVRHLLTVRKDARGAVEAVASSMTSVEAMKSRMREIFQQHLERLNTLWSEDVTANCRKRVEAAFDALLPIETLNDVKRTLICITIEKSEERLQHWRATNISMEIFSKDIHVDATKLMEGGAHLNTGGGGNSRRTSQNLIIDLTATHQPSEFFQLLQVILHRASLRPGSLSEAEVTQLIQMSENVLDTQTLPSNAYRNVAFYLLQLALLLVANCPDFITKDLLAKLFTVWRHEKLISFTTLRGECSEDNEEEQIHQLRSQQRLKVNSFIFSSVISARFMVMMRGRDRKHLQVYGDFLIALIRESFITVEIVNELSVGLYKYEWSKSTLGDIAFLVEHVKSFLPSSSTSSARAHENAESHLFMELVADMAREMEDF